jgi:hypothetical protein
VIRRWVEEVAYVRDRLRVTRTAVLAFSLWMTWEVWTWVMAGVATGTITSEWMANGMLATVSTFTGAVFKFYGQAHALAPPQPPARSEGLE